MKKSQFIVLAIFLRISCSAQTSIPLDSFYIPGASWTEVVETSYYPCSKSVA